MVGGMAYTPAELEYLRSQPLGRMATVGSDGVVQVNPVGFRIQTDGTLVIGGYSMASTRKFRNVAETGRAAIVVDDIAALDPWTVRGIEVRGRAEATTADEPPIPGTTHEVVVIHPDVVFAWGIDPEAPGMTRRVQPG
jgi:pyridoxamine 5'-phosphate oxidase family protein